MVNSHLSAKSQLILRRSISGCTLWTQACLVLLEADSKSYKPFLYEEQEGQLPSGAIPKKLIHFFNASDYKNLLKRLILAATDHSLGCVLSIYCVPRIAVHARDTGEQGKEATNERKSCFYYAGIPGLE